MATSKGSVKKVDGFKIETRYISTRDIAIKSPTQFPVPIDRTLLLRFAVPSSPNLHIDFKNTSISATISVARSDGTDLEEDIYSITSEPLFAMIRSFTVYSMGRCIFRVDDFNWLTYVNRLMQDQSLLESTAQSLSGYGIDSVPFNTPNATGTQQLYRYNQLKDGMLWALRGVLPIAEFGTWVSGDSILVPSTMGLSFEFEFASSDMLLFRKQDEKSVPLKVNLHDFQLIANMKTLASEIPRNRMTAVKIPHFSQAMYNFHALKGSSEISSGQWSSPNTPHAAVIFITKGNTESQFENALEVLSYAATEIHLDISGRTHVQVIDSLAKRYNDAYFNTVRTMCPEVGKFSIDRANFATGMCFFAANLGKTGNLSLDTLDAASLKSPCIITLTIKLGTPLRENVDVRVVLFGTGRTVIDESTKDFEVELL